MPLYNSAPQVHKVLISAGAHQFRFKLLSGNAVLNMGKDVVHYWSPYPALKAFPLELAVLARKSGMKFQ